MTQKRFVKNAVSGTEWSLYKENVSSDVDFYHHYTKSLFATIQTIERQNEIENTTKKSHRISYARQKGLREHPSQVRAANSTMSSAIMHGKSERSENRSFNCWTPACSLRVYPKIRNKMHTKRNLDQWK